MKLFSNVLKRTRQARAKNLFLSFALFLTLSVGGVIGVQSVSQSGTVDAAAASACSDNSPNSFIRNGASSRSDFIKKVNASSQLQSAYASFGLSKADYSRFVSSAKPGLALSNNTIVVDGKTVATNVGSMGRIAGCQGSSGVVKRTVGGATYYGNLNSKAFASGTKSIPVDVLFNSKGAVQFAVMTGACANPTYQTPVQPSYACHALQSKSLGNNSYSFTTDADAGHGAKISKLVYDFGDGTGTKTTTNPNTAVPHTFTKSATVTVKVYVSLPGGGQIVLTNCAKKITFIPPPAVFACEVLTLTPGTVNKTSGSQSYTLTATSSATNATIQSYTFDLDNNVKQVVATSAKTARTTHVFAPGTYSVTVSVTVKTDTGAIRTVTAAKCAGTIKVKTPECKPGVPVNSPECKPSTLACVSLTLVPGSTDATNRMFTLKAVGSADNATITSYVFDFGDSSPKQTVTTGATTASSAAHTYAATGDFTASVVVNGKDASGKVVTGVAAPSCAQPIPTPQPQTPGIKIVKTVDGQKSEQVDLGQNFVYQLVITNNGQQNLTNAVVTDPAPQGVTMLSADLGTITNNSFSYTIPSLAVGDSVTVNITAVVNTFVAGNMVNQACVNAPEVNPTQPNQPDSCDTATVTVPQPPALIDTGAGGIVGIFGATAIVGTIGYRLFLGRRLSREG